jgi:hypothetical protein
VVKSGAAGASDGFVFQVDVGCGIPDHYCLTQRFFRREERDGNGDTLISCDFYLRADEGAQEQETDPRPAKVMFALFIQLY